MQDIKSDKENLNITYDWFDSQIASRVIKAVSSYWEINFNMMMNEINSFESIKDDPVLKGELFYTCQIPIKNKQHITLRISSDFIRIIFHDIFGSNYPVFDLEKLTELERTILNNFFEHIIKSMDELIIKDTEVDKIDPLIKTNLNFVFLIKNKDMNAGKLALTIPLNRLEPEKVKRENNFEFDDFINNVAYVDIEAGSSKISLSDLKNLDREDILLLETSDIKTMTLKTPTVVKEFKVNPEPSIMIDAQRDDDESEFENEKGDYMPDNKSMWDDIQIEVSAEFKRVKMTLGELKQISKGLVIDLGPIMNNEISLLVENKTVAKGELVIINDKYGVKVTEVFASKKQEKETDSEIKNQPPLQPQAPSNGAQNAGAPHNPQKPAPAPSRPQGARPAPAPSRPQGPRPAPKPAPAPSRPQGARPAPAPKAQGAPQEPAKDDFDYSNFEE